MNYFKIRLLGIIFALLLSACADNSESYWQITRIHRADNEPLSGLSLMNMQEIIDNNFHFVKRNDSLRFDFPEKFTIAIGDISTLQQLRITEESNYKLYETHFKKDEFYIKFKDNATLSESKNTIIEFRRVDQKAYHKEVKEAIAARKEVATKFHDFKDQLIANPSIVLKDAPQLVLKEQNIYDDKENSIHLKIPAATTLRESGDLNNETFGNISIGTFKENSKVYDLKHPALTNGLRDLNIFVSTAPATFAMEDYIKKNKNHLVFEQTENSAIGYALYHDEKNKEVVIDGLFCLKYLQTDSNHVFVYSYIPRTTSGSEITFSEMNEILNFNYSLLASISLVQ